MMASADHQTTDGKADTLISTDEPGNSFSANRRSGTTDTGAKSDHGDRKVGFFENVRRKIARLGGEDTRSHGIIDHLNKEDLLDLAADLGCISSENQSFTFKGENSSQGHQKKLQKRASDSHTGSQKRSNGLTFSDHDLEVNSNLDGNIVCTKLKMRSKHELCSNSCNCDNNKSAASGFEK